MRRKEKIVGEKITKDIFKLSLNETEKLDTFVPDKLDDPKTTIIQVIMKVDNPGIEHKTFLSKIISNKNIGGIYEHSEMLGIDEDWIYEYCLNNTVGLSKYEGYNVTEIEVVVYSMNE